MDLWVPGLVILMEFDSKGTVSVEIALTWVVLLGQSFDICPFFLQLKQRPSFNSSHDGLGLEEGCLFDLDWELVLELDDEAFGLSAGRCEDLSAGLSAAFGRYGPT